MTVLPNAPIDPDTGLPVPTIAVATDGGVSVIKDDGSVVSKSSNLSNYNHSMSFNIQFDGQDVVFTAWNNSSAHSVVRWDLNLTTMKSVFSKYATAPSQTGVNVRLPKYSSAYSTKDMVARDGGFTVATGDGLFNIHEQSGSPLDSLVNAITKDFNTGWMNGDIKLATLMDTTAETISAPELVTNGDFSNGTTGWSIVGSGASAQVVNGELVVTRNGTGAHAQQSIPTEIGKTYILSVDLTAATGAASIGVELGSSMSEIGSTLKTYTVIHTATSTTTLVDINTFNTMNGTITVDNISVVEVVADRSVNGNGLNIVGNVTKSAVATGAELVGYGAFSTANHLKQDYNSDLDFGTGDFSFLTWFKGTDAYGVFAGTNATISTGFNVSTTGTVPSVKYRVHCGSEHTDAPYSTLIYGDTWNQLAVARKDGVLSIYENGVLLHSETNTGNITGGGSLAVGYRQYDNAQNYGGKLALLRISATAPTSEQIAKIYRDEKPLFQEGAKCTLSSSDDVKAIAYDEDLSVLHVSNGSGSSAYRDEFVGLQNVVANQLTESSENVSACNGLVVED